MFGKVKDYAIYGACGLAACWLVSNVAGAKTAASFGLLYKPTPGPNGAAGQNTTAAGLPNSK